MAKKFYIKKRYNRQFDEPYYVPKGKMTKKDANKTGNSLYGDNYMLAYATEQEYKDAIDKLKADGFRVH